MTGVVRFTVKVVPGAASTVYCRCGKRSEPLPHNSVLILVWKRDHLCDEPGESGLNPEGTA